MLNTLEQGNVYVDAGATATDVDASGATVNASALITTSIAGNADATQLLPGDSFQYSYDATDAAGNTAATAVRVIQIVNPCAAGGSKEEPTYAGEDGLDTKESLCSTLDPNTGEYAYSAAGACTSEGLCVGLDYTPEEVVEVDNTAPVLVLLGRAWLISLATSHVDI